MKSLKRKYTGHYELVEGILKVSLVKTSNNEWESVIEVFKGKYKDFEGNEVDVYENIGENTFSRTKKEGLKCLENRIKNL